MPSDIKHAPPSATQTAMSTELNSLADGQRALASSAIDNAASLDQYADFELAVPFDDAPNEGGSLLLWLVPALDGTNYADGDGSATPQAHLLAGHFQLRAEAGLQRLHLRGVALPPFKFKTLIQNHAGLSLPASGTTLRYRTYNDQVQ